MRLSNVFFLLLALAAVAVGLRRDLKGSHLGSGHLSANGSTTPKELNQSSAAINVNEGSPLGTVQTAGWDPNDVADPADYERFRAKGAWLGCLSRATDEEAGNAWPDPLNRTPKSARAPWTGELSGASRLVYVQIDMQKLTLRQSCTRGDGPRAATIKTTIATSATGAATPTTLARQ